MLRDLTVTILRGLIWVLRLLAAPLLRLRLRRRDKSERLLALRGFGSQHAICFIGRVSEDLAMAEHDTPGEPHRHLLHRLRDAYRLLISRPVPNANVEIAYAGRRWQMTSDDSGLLFDCFELDGAPARPMWQGYEARLLTPAEPGDEVKSTGEVFMLPPTAQRVIISDLDDTVIFTGVANKLMMFWRLFAATAQERVPFPGVAEFYRGLHAGAADGGEGNPIIYVSRSPWSIYPTLDAFFRMHRIPTGPILMLRDWGITYRDPLPRRAPEHKDEMIDMVLRVYPDLPVVLVGDSGQRDPEVYTGLAERHPGRIAAIYIRDLEQSDSRTRELADMGARLSRQGIDFVSAPDTAALAEHAAGRGWLETGGKHETRRAAAGGRV